tara:strand:- start:199 stop:951 length:753 start_codon:yes stop_codon:yes gene_type:complete
MTNRLIEFDLLEEGTLLKRYKRFLADIRLDNGMEITAHCPNTGPMKGLLFDNSRVRVSFSPSPKRKLSWTWEQVEITGKKGDKLWVGVNTLFANKLIRKVIEANLLYQFIGEIELIKPEVVYGKEKKSKIDFFITPKSSNPDKRDIYIEVKNTTWAKDNFAIFPDTITTRGQKHLKELMSIIPNSNAFLIPCITRSDVEFFSTGDEVDPLYGQLFRESIKKGLKVIPCCFTFHKDYVAWEKFIPILKIND